MNTVCLYDNVFGIAMFLSTVTRLKRTIYKWVKNLKEKREDMIDDTRQG